MNWEEYTKGVLATANPKLTTKEAKLSATLGLVGEAGEVSELIKKAFFHDKPLDHDKLIKELGDVCYYLAWFTNLYNITLAEIMIQNQNKLKARHPNGFSGNYNSKAEDERRQAPGTEQNDKTT